MLCCGRLYSGEDTAVTSASAEVAGEAFLNLRERRLRILFEQVMRGENHSGGADAALRPAVLEEALLDGIELWTDGEAFDGADGCAVGLQCRDEAGVDELAVQQDGAGATLTFAAAFFCSGKVQVFAEEIEEPLHR